MMHVKECSGHCWREKRSHPSAGSYGFMGWLLCLLSSSKLPCRLSWLIRNVLAYPVASVQFLGQSGVVGKNA